MIAQRSNGQLQIANTERAIPLDEGRKGIRFDFTGQMPNSWAKEVEHDLWWRAAMRRVISVEIYRRYDNGRDCSMPCTFHRTWLPVEQPRNRASRASSACPRAWSPVSLWSNLCGFATSVTVGFLPLLASIRVHVGFHPPALLVHYLTLNTWPYVIPSPEATWRLACLSRLIDGEFSGHSLRGWKPANWYSLPVRETRCSSSLRENLDYLFLR